MTGDMFATLGLMRRRPWTNDPGDPAYTDHWKTQRLPVRRRTGGRGYHLLDVARHEETASRRGLRQHAVFLIALPEITHALFLAATLEGIDPFRGKELKDVLDDLDRMISELGSAG